MIDISIYDSIRNIPISASELAALIGERQKGRTYCSPRNKLVSLEKKGKIIRLKRGLYVLNSTNFGFPLSAPICSNHIYGPSYLSSQWALSYYGAIPERTTVYTATTIKRSRNFENTLGMFTYNQVGQQYFNIGIRNVIIDDAQCLIASPEKALADLILFDNYVPSKSVRSLYQYLEEDIRLDMDELKHFNTAILQQCADTGRKKSTIKNLIKIIEKL